MSYKDFTLYLNYKKYQEYFLRSIKRQFEICSLNSPQTFKKKSAPIETKPAKNRVRRTRRAIVFFTLFHSLNLTSAEAGFPEGQRALHLRKV